MTYFQPPQQSELPDNAYGKMVMDGYALFVDTRRQAPKFGNGLNCTNCHLDQGRLANSAPLWGAYPMYPAYRKKNDKVNTLAERLQGCFQFSMNGGTPPAADSREITALSTYAYWLSTKAPVGVEPPDAATPTCPSLKVATTWPVVQRCTRTSVRFVMATTAKGKRR